MLTSTGSAASARGEINPRPIAAAHHGNIVPPNALVPRLTSDGVFCFEALGCKQDRIMLTLQARILWYVATSGITIMRAWFAAIFLALMVSPPAHADTSKLAVFDLEL